LVGDWQVLQTQGGVLLPFVPPSGYEDLLPDVGTEFAFVGDLSGSDFHGAQYGVASAGFGYFAPDDRFDTTKPSNVLYKPADPDGINFGLASAISGTAQPGTTKDPVIVGGSVQFLFNFTGSLSTSDISNVNFQYGTSPSEPNIIVPEPATVSLLGVGIAGLSAARYVRRKRA